ncbi:glycosyltransferase [Aeromicrobium sp.]|uniref:arsenate reductase/protein-tyrosine-phosphatase family protein n=1 Tax=Aeromicrobium sp. TaxID=1871063 RepID=UPI0019B2BFBF|nr:glycosyltransferase [Aeromicrobium sp.]MBC7631150.1 glycosyltransferase [Aeromicrobium sp.]
MRTEETMDLPEIRVLLVCSGNICRSPVAERLLQSRSLAGAVVHAESAGTGALVGEPIHPQMVDVMRASGVELAEFAARQLMPHMIQAADLVLTMTREQRATVLRLDPRALAKTFTLTECAALVISAGSFGSAESLAARRPYIALEPSDYDIPDPYRRRDNAFQQAFASINKAVDILCNGPTTATAQDDSASSGDEAPAVMTVLESFPEPRPTAHPYVVMLRRALEQTDGITVRTFSWRTALTGDYDVFHVHWPENLVSGGSPLKKLVRQAMFIGLLRRLRRRRIPLVRTVHNLELPRGISRRETALLKRADRQTMYRIKINGTTPIPADQPSSTILHGHYRRWYDNEFLAEVVTGRVAFFGLIRRYKGVDDLISAFRELPEAAEISLSIAGRPSSEKLVAQLRDLASGDDRINIQFGFLSDGDLARHVTAAELVVLPYREMHNSGGVLTALSLGRPVLVPANDTNLALAQEVGLRWVQMYEGDLDGSDIVRALKSVRDDPEHAPDLSRREWKLAGPDHLDAFIRAIEILHPRPQPQ